MNLLFEGIGMGLSAITSSRSDDPYPPPPQQPSHSSYQQSQNDEFRGLNATAFKAQHEKQDVSDVDSETASVAIGMGVYTIGSVFVLLTSVLIYVSVHTVPLAIVSVSYLGLHEMRVEVTDIRDRALAGHTRAQKHFVDIVNPPEDGWNAFWTLYNFGIIVWDLSLPFITWFFQTFKDIFFVILKLLFGPGMRQIFQDLVALIFELAIVLMNAFAELCGALSNDDQIQTGVGLDNPDLEGTVGVGVVNPLSKVNRFLVRGAQLFMRYYFRFLILMNTDLYKFIELAFNVYLKYLHIVFQAMLFVLQLLEPDQPLGKLIGSILHFQCKLTKWIYGSCHTQKIIAKNTCKAKDEIAGLFNLIRSLLKTLCSSCDIYDKVEGCNVNELNITCTKPTCQGAGLLGLGQCDEAECAVDVANILVGMEALNRNCSYWTSTEAILDCMVFVRDYSDRNSSSTAKQPIETIGAELCFVIRSYVITECGASQPPFGFDHALVVQNACTDDYSGLGSSFQSQCACVFDTPLCDNDCCRQYSAHFHGQVYARIGHRTLQNIQAKFPRSVFCPMDTATKDNITVFSDYTYPHASCNFWEKVLYPIIQNAAPLLRLNDVGVVPLYRDTYINDTCQRTVDQVGVCILLNATVDEQLYDVAHQVGLSDSESLYDANSVSEYDGMGIVTTPTTSTPVSALQLLHVQKYYCQDFSVVYNNSLLMYRYNTWDVNSVVSQYCDQSIISAYMSMHLQKETTVSSRTSEGTHVDTDLAGLPPEIEVFGASVPPPNEPEDCDFEADAATQQHCVGGQATEINDIGQDLEDNGLESLDGLATGQQKTAPATHLANRKPIDPSDPLYAQKTAETQQLNDAQNFPVDGNPLSNEDIPDETEPIDTRFQDPVHDGDPLDGTPLHYDWSNGAARVPLSITVQNNETEIQKETEEYEKKYRDELKRTERLKKDFEQLGLLWHKFVHKMRGWVKEIRNMRESPEESLRRDYVFSEARARRGIERFKRMMRIRNEELEAMRENNITETHPQYMIKTRHLLGIPDEVNATVGDLGFIHAVLLGLGTPPTPSEDEEEMINNLGISNAEFDEFQSEQVLKNMQFMATEISNKILPKFYDLFYAAIDGTDLPDYMLFVPETPLGAVGGSQCRNTNEHPLRCCVDGASPYECCVGLIGCMPTVSKSIYAERTTKETIRKWKCSRFDTFTKEWISSIRVITTVGLNGMLSFLNALGADKVRIVVNFMFSWAVYGKDNFPENAGGCMFLYSEYILLGTLLVTVLYFFVTSSMFVELLIYVKASSANTARDQEISASRKKIDQMWDLLNQKYPGALINI